MKTVRQSKISDLGQCDCVKNGKFHVWKKMGGNWISANQVRNVPENKNAERLTRTESRVPLEATDGEATEVKVVTLNRSAT